MGKIILSVFDKVFEVLLIINKEIVYQPIKHKPLIDKIAKDIKYIPYFKDCLDVLDSIHLFVYIAALDYVSFQNRKGNLSQNILEICILIQSFAIFYQVEKVLLIMIIF